jgi:3',5'-cyclic AMP phosphodiesterase CpdA
MLSNSVDSINSSPETDFVLFNGDLTKDGEKRNFEKFDSTVESLEVPSVATPGNHDVPKSWDSHDTPPLSEFKRRYAPEGYPIVREVGDSGVKLVVLNSADTPDGSLSDTHAGHVSTRQLILLDILLHDLTNPVVALHHSLEPVVDSDKRKVNNYSVKNSEKLLGILEKHDVPILVSGHHHIPSTVEYGSVRGVIAPATSTYPQSYLRLDIDESGTEVSLVPVADEYTQSKAYEAAVSTSRMRGKFVLKAEDNLRKAPLNTEKQNTSKFSQKKSTLNH